MKDHVDRAVRAISLRNSYVLVWAQFGIAHVIVAGGILLLALYQQMSRATLWELIVVSQVLVSLDNSVSIKVTWRMWRPVRAWEQATRRGERDPELAVEAWSALASFPLQYMRRMRQYPFLLAYLPFVAWLTWRLRLDWYLFFVVCAVGTVVLLSAVIVRYFTLEVVIRPVLERISDDLPRDFVVPETGLPLRWRLLATAPVINLITGVVVAGVSAGGHRASIRDLGVQWLVALGVSFTVSLELAVLVFRALGATLDDLQSALARLRAGDLTVRMPLVASDETGQLSQSFNTMVEGLEERERLRDAFGAYVDPALAERVLREGTDLEGEEVEVSVLFLDVRDFTAYAESAAPHEVVALLGELWELVVPVVLRHGGHANKFIGDGMLAVFGAPERLEDHANQAVRAGLEILARIDAQFADRVSVGIGINSGPVIAGTVGGGGRVEFTVIGDTVNTAARVEQATRATGDGLLITDDTCSRLGGEWQLDERPPVALKGKRAAVRLWVPASADPTTEPAPGAQGVTNAARI